MFGIDQDKVTAGFFLTTTHPDDLKRHHLARSKLISVAQEILSGKAAHVSFLPISGEEYPEALIMLIIFISALFFTVKFHTNPHFLYL